MSARWVFTMDYGTSKQLKPDGWPANELGKMRKHTTHIEIVNGTTAIRYTYDQHKKTFVCACGFEANEHELFFGAKQQRASDKLTAHEIAHRLTDE